MNRLLPIPRWALMQWGAMLGMMLYFDIMWCYDTTFTALSMPMTWINALLLSLLLSMPAMLFGSRWAQLCVLGAVAVWLECNLMYCRTYFSHIPLSSYGLASNLADFGSSVLDSLRWRDLGFLAIFAIALFLPRGEKQAMSRRRAVAYIACVGVLAMASGIGFACYGGYMEMWTKMANANYHSTRVPQYTLAGALVHDYVDAGPTLTPERQAAIDRWAKAQRPLEPLPDSIGTRDNLVLVLCESLESWPIGLKLEGKEVTPNLNRFLADSASLYAPNVLTQVGAGRSIDGQLLYNAGMLPLQNEVYSFSYPQNTYCTLNQALAQLRGAKSYILTPDKPLVWNQQLVAQSFGIDTLLARDCWKKEELLGGRKKTGDRPLMRQITEKMKAGVIWPEGENAFVQVVTYSGHNPFEVPEEYDNLKLQGDYPRLLRNYATCAHYTDEALGILVDYLMERPDWGRTMVVIVGDHEGLAAYRNEFASQYPWVCSRPMTPLVVLNSPMAERYEGVMGQVDVYPTLLQLMGLTDYQWHGIGQSILQRGYASPDQDSLMQVRSRASDTMIRFYLSLPERAVSIMPSAGTM